MPKIIRFTSSWCAPCRQLAPIMKELEEENKEIEFETIDLSDDNQLAIDYGVKSIPTLIFLKNEKEVDRIVGGAPKDEIQERIFLLQE